MAVSLSTPPLVLRSDMWSPAYSNANKAVRQWVRRGTATSRMQAASILSSLPRLIPTLACLLLALSILEGTQSEMRAASHGVHDRHPVSPEMVGIDAGSFLQAAGCSRRSARLEDDRRPRARDLEDLHRGQKPGDAERDQCGADEQPHVHVHAVGEA